MNILKLIGLEKTENQERELLAPQESRTVKLGLIVGHDNKEQGAVLTGTPLTEYTYNKQVAEKAKAHAEERFEKFVNVEVICRDKIGIEGAYKLAENLGCDFVIELHFNAFNKTAKGTETLCSADADSREFARAMHERCIKTFNRTLGREDRGVRVLGRGDRGARNVYAFKGPSCLVEPFFGDHIDEATIALAKQEQYAKDIIDAVSKYGKAIGLLPL